jgi:hypothetical protein
MGTGRTARVTRGCAAIAACATVASLAACTRHDDLTLPNVSSAPSSSADEGATTVDDTMSTTQPVGSSAPPGEPSTTTTTTSSSSTTTTTTTTSEPAQSRPESGLPRPTGFNRFEPGPALDGVAAFTGLPTDATITARPALAVKIDNAEGGDPQWNLTAADMVFEENVEGVTRFVAVFQTNTPDRIGPVRSARTSDIDILASLNRPILAWSGGNPGVTGAVRGAHDYGWLTNLSAQSTSCFYRSATRQAPHNLLLDPLCAWNSATLAGPARPVFTFDPVALPGVSESQFKVRMDGLSIEWRWNAGTQRYERRQRGAWHTDVDGNVVGADNVVELFIEYVKSDADERSPEAVTLGSGRAIVHRGGTAIAGHWSRADRFSAFVLTTDDGTVLTLAPGTVFVELRRN